MQTSMSVIEVVVMTMEERIWLYCIPKTLSIHFACDYLQGIAVYQGSRCLEFPGGRRGVMQEELKHYLRHNLA